VCDLSDDGTRSKSNASRPRRAALNKKSIDSSDDSSNAGDADFGVLSWIHDGEVSMRFYLASFTWCRVALPSLFPTTDRTRRGVVVVVANARRVQKM